MGGHYQILIPLLSLFLVRVDLTDLFPLNLRVQILEVIDGDTVLLRYRHQRLRLRLALIDAPELEQPYLSGSSGAGLLARRCLFSELSGKNEFVASLSSRDLYGRYLGDINGVSFRLVRAGCAVIYPNAVFSSRSEKFRFLRALAEARGAKRGLWKFGGIAQPKKWRRSSKRFAGPQSRR